MTASFGLEKRSVHLHWVFIIGHSNKCFSSWTLPAHLQRSLSSFFHFTKLFLVLATPAFSRLSIFHDSYFRLCPSGRLSITSFHIGSLTLTILLSFHILFRFVIRMSLFVLCLKRCLDLKRFAVTTHPCSGYLES